MNNALLVLLVESSSNVTDGVRRELKQSAFSLLVKTVAGEKDLLRALATKPDVLLTTCSNPAITPALILEMLRGQNDSPPLIVLCDRATEALALDALAKGASDYVFTDSLARLPWAIRAAARSSQLQAECDQSAQELLRLEAEERAALEVLRRSEEQYRSIVEGAIEGVVIHQNEIIRYANPAAARLSGYDSPGELVGRNMFETFVAPQARAELIGRCAACLRGETPPFHPGWPGIRRDGRLIWLQSSVTLISWQGQPAFLGYFSDISERKQAEEQLRLSEARFSKAFHGSPLPVSIVTLEEGRYLDANASLAEMVGWRRDEIIGQTAFDLNLWTDRKDRGALVQLVVQNSVARNFETRLRVKSGEVRDVLISAERIALDTEACMIVVTQDITERKRAEASLRESEERFRQLAENVAKVFWITDPENTAMIYISPAYEQIWGRSCASLYASPRSWMDAVHPDDQEHVRQSNITRGTRDVVYRIVRPDGSVRWIRDRAFPVRNPAGAIHRVAGIAEDITEQRELEEQFRQAQKMEAVGQLAGGIAHDFNNLLTIIHGHASLLLEEEDVPELIRDAAEQISLASDRAASLVRQLLTFSRRQIMQPRILEINEVIDRMGKMLRRILGEDVELEFHTTPGLPSVHADVGMIEQVLLNMAVNARDAMPNGGRLTIATHGIALNEPLEPGPDGQTGPVVCITVSDTGCGIPPENLSRLFEPFFTTKGVGKGTGLGLATAYGIVRQHRGWIRVQSEVARGTTFRIYLPAANGEGQGERQLAGETSVRGGTETILLVEDERTLRSLVRSVLERYGYQVFEAGSGKSALALWQQHKERIDLVLTDIVMPEGMSGAELAQNLRRDKPRLKVIFTSGYSAEAIARDLILEEGLNFLQKPYDPKLLAGIVRSCLDSA